MNFQTITLITTVVLALLGYLVTYWNNLRISKRKEQLELINKRISDFYGPLYVSTQTGRTAYVALLNKIGRDHIFDDPDHPPTDEDKLEWRIWVSTVFMPNNEFIENLILENAYLIQEKEMPRCLLDFGTHVSGYKALLEKWHTGDFAEDLSVINFPRDIEKYALESYQELKEIQLDLISHEFSSNVI